MNKYSAKNTNAELKDVSWHNTFPHINEEGKKIVLSGKPGDSELNLYMWLIELLAKNNEQVLVAVDDDWNFVVEKNTITIYDPNYAPEADRLDNHKKILIHFWDLLEHTKGRRMKLRIMNSELGMFYSAIFFMFKRKAKQAK